MQCYAATAAAGKTSQIWESLSLLQYQGIFRAMFQSTLKLLPSPVLMVSEAIL